MNDTKSKVYFEEFKCRRCGSIGGLVCSSCTSEETNQTDSYGW